MKCFGYLLTCALRERSRRGGEHVGDNDALGLDEVLEEELDSSLNAGCNDLQSTGEKAQLVERTRGDGADAFF